MAERGIDSGIWSNPKIQGLSTASKLLYVYLTTNGAVNPAGLYRISFSSMSFDTGISVDDLPNLLTELATADVEYMSSRTIVWVKKFFERQCHSPQFAIAAIRGLRRELPDFLEKWLEYNDTVLIPYRYRIDTLLIEYGYPMGRVAIPPSAVPKAKAVNNKGLGDDKGEGDAEIGGAFKCFEENIGMITPLIGEAIKDAMQEYPAGWVEDAIKVAVERNKRKWSYVRGILESWSRDGRDAKGITPALKPKQRGRDRVPVDGRYTRPEELDE